MSQWSRDTYRAGDPYDSDTDPDTNPEDTSPTRTPSPNYENEQDRSNQKDEYSPTTRSPSPESGEEEQSGSDEDDSDTREPGSLWDDRRTRDVGTTTWEEMKRLWARGSENWDEDQADFMERKTALLRRDAADQSDSEEETA